MSDPTPEDLEKAREWLGQFRRCRVGFTHWALEDSEHIDRRLVAFCAEARREEREALREIVRDVESVSGCECDGDCARETVGEILRRLAERD